MVKTVVEWRVVGKTVGKKLWVVKRIAPMERETVEH